MLLHFFVENFLSFRDEANLTMLPLKRIRKHRDHILTDNTNGKGISALPVALVYGANASGKSNLVKAMLFARKLIIEGTPSNRRITLPVFCLEKRTLRRPARFEFVISHEGTVYSYGFAVTPSCVEEEWLFATKQSRETTIFERRTVNDSVQVEFGAGLEQADSRERMEFVAQGTRPNQLFLREANDHTARTVKPVMGWFLNRLEVLGPGARSVTLPALLRSDNEFKGFLGELLRVSDTGIDGVGVKLEPLDFTKRFPRIADELRKITDERLPDGEGHIILEHENEVFMLKKDRKNTQPVMYVLNAKHRASGGRKVDFDMARESDGTIRMMHLASALRDMQNSEKVYVIDEIDRSLHPTLCKFLVETFLQSHLHTGAGSQLIATTHQTGLMDLNILRRDEIVFAEKDETGCSRLTTLADFKYKVRADLRAERSYLSGRFGGVPVLRSFREATGR